MKSFAFVALSTLALVSQTTAQLIAYSAPISATQWTAGQPATISWTNSCNEIVGNTTFPVYLNQQVGLYQVQVPGIPELGYLDCKKPGKITVQVPATLPQGNAYSILVTNGGNQSYSALFTILSTIPGSTTSALPTTTLAPVTTTTTVAPITTTSATTTATATPTTKPNQAGSLKTGSQVAFVVVAAVASLLL
ncbi:hypothetical protein BKA57DRAFT_500594 [Linnemannia elongata]|uniref:Yeast cell wall synthesis Kre9/Knh1-like N-terminal domain-containing protein n=1 Tax=Linnemannia elongata AG-77 TaxID=1314771 RepID=A0A197JYD3_9FUNG|nr:hypothetical protein BGZ89_011248 [Linnemannia elongata]KAH7056236.1 hypothetical protein BKA57DRAFT_500594 [Linnemannia elongata]OAQ29958.1 hypothetical protein K457DRAFT_137507 [Linnemannia elongata AG-77]